METLQKERPQPAAPAEGAAPPVPAEAPVKAPAEAPAEAPVKAPAEAPAEGQAPADASADVQTSPDAPAEGQAPADASADVQTSMDLPAAGEMLPPEENYPEEGEMIQALKARRFRLRPELVMGLVALLAAGVLLWVAIMCIPYYGGNEDPELLPQYHSQATQPAYEPEPEPTGEPGQEETQPEADPTVPPLPNPYDPNDFQYNQNNYLLLQNLESYPGIDVSAYQGDIDWVAVRRSGIHFALVRLGYRGYGSGKLVEDEFAQKNLAGAKAAGIQLGAYFFSQALTIQEVDEEIAFMLDILGDTQLDMPIVLDWEIPNNEARTAGKMDARSLTDLQLHFCQKMTQLGYQPMVYFNWSQSESLYYLSEMENYPFWLALYQDRMTYPWKIHMWQYTDRGRVPGIAGNVDLNVYMPG